MDKCHTHGCWHGIQGMRPQYGRDKTPAYGILTIGNRIPSEPQIPIDAQYPKLACTHLPIVSDRGHMTNMYVGRGVSHTRQCGILAITGMLGRSWTPTIPVYRVCMWHGGCTGRPWALPDQSQKPPHTLRTRAYIHSNNTSKRRLCT